MVVYIELDSKPQELLKQSYHSGKLIVGTKQTVKLVSQGKAKCVYIAKDASFDIMNRVLMLCADKGVEVIYADSMQVLGKLCGIEVGAAIACVC